MTARFERLSTPLAGLTLLQRKPIGDRRGFLERLYCAEELEDIASGRQIVQINRTLTAARGTVRGMHYQHPPHAEMKFVTCLRGEVFDVAVDLRRDSPTFLRWHAEILGADNARTFCIPEGFAHGFQCLADNCELLYFHTARYCSDAEAGLGALDPRLAIEWPLSIADQSPRDLTHPPIADDFRGLAL
jgi:dTDP-4-dehydrorhamnose 3,5-epimerase